MKTLKIFSLLLLFSVVIFSQKPIILLFEPDSRPILKFRNEIKIGGYGEYLIAKKFLDDDYHLLTITNFGIRLWNTKTGELIASRSHEILDIDKFDTVLSISPDGSKMVVTDAMNISLGKLLGKKPKLPATVYDLQTGRQLALLQRPEHSIRRAVWSRDGRTLITYSNAFGQGYNMEICFWDGETFEFRGSISANSWNYLTRRGDRIFTTSGAINNTLGIKYEKPNTIVIWSTITGKLEKTLPLKDEKSLKKIRVTDDGKFLLTENDRHIILLDLETGVQQNFSARGGSAVDNGRISPDQRYLAAENNGKILVWDKNGSGLPKFEITTPPPVGNEKLTTNMVGFNFDNKHLAIWQMRYEKTAIFFKVPKVVKTEFYDLETGQVNPEISLYINPTSAVFSSDHKYAITHDCNRGNLNDLENLKELYFFPLNCKVGRTTISDGNESQTENYYYNDDIIAFHPEKNVSLVVKDEVLELYGVDPERKRLQIVYAPRTLRKGFFNAPFSNGSLEAIFDSLGNAAASVNSEPDSSVAGFLFDGDIVFATSADLRSIFFWDVDKKLMY